MTAIDMYDPEQLKTAFIEQLPNIDGELDCERLYLLGEAYLKGYAVDRDVERALELLEKAAAFKCEDAIKAAGKLSDIYEDGTIGTIDYKKALFWKERTVELCEKVYGKESINTAVFYNNAGVSYLNLADLFYRIFNSVTLYWAK